MKKNILTLSILLLASMALIAQVPPPGGSGLPPDGIPIDGGLCLLLAGMVGYAYKKFKSAK